MRTIVPALFLAIILALLSRRLQTVLRREMGARPVLVFVPPAVLSLLFCGIASAIGALSLPLAALVIVYTFVPAGYAYGVRKQPAPIWSDFLLILWLWLPLEFAAGARWVPKPAQGLLHMAAYGVSVTLGLVLFLLCRRLEGVKYNLPTRVKDLTNVLIGFVVVLPVLFVLGRVLGFLVPFHMPSHSSAISIALQFVVILAATALPEEILFRGFIQNCLMQKFGFNTRTLLGAALIFGCSHLNNGPQAAPNWRYMILATIAGAVYGKVFEQSSSILASASLHALINTIKHVYF